MSKSRQLPPAVSAHLRRRSFRVLRLCVLLLPRRAKEALPHAATSRLIVSKINYENKRMWKTTGIFRGPGGVGARQSSARQAPAPVSASLGRPDSRQAVGIGGRDPASRQTVQLRRRVWWTGGLAGVATAYLPRISWSQARLALRIHQRFDYSVSRCPSSRCPLYNTHTRRPRTEQLSGRGGAAGGEERARGDELLSPCLILS